MAGPDISWLVYLAPQTILLVSAIALPLFQHGMERRSLGIAAFTAMLLAVLYSLLMLPLFGITWGTFEGSGFDPTFNSGAGIPVFGRALVVDAFSVFFQLVFLSVGLLVVLASMGSLKDDSNLAEYYSLVFIATVGMTFVAMARDIITIYIGLEVASISTIALAAFRKREHRSIEAGVKLLIIGGISSALTLFGISLIYGVAGTTNVEALAANGGALLFRPGFWPIVTLAFIFLFAGLGFKVSAVPFHMWAPDVYEGAPTPITVLLAAGSKKMGFAAVFYIFVVAMFTLRIDPSTGIAALIGGVSILTMTLGNVLAISQSNIKRMLAYSSIAHAGYILIAAAVGTQSAVAGGLYHILVHAFMKGGAFIAVSIVALHVGEDIRDYRGLRYRSPLVAFSFTLLLLSLAGIPPLGGFASKYFLFSSAIQDSVVSGGWAWMLAVAGVLNSALSLYYYARVIKYMYVLGDGKRRKAYIKEEPVLLAALLLATYVVLMMGIFPGPFYDLAVDAARALLL